VREAKAGSEKAQRLFLISTVRHQVAGTATNVKRWLKTGNRKGRFREPPVPAVPARTRRHDRAPAERTNPAVETGRSHPRRVTPSRASPPRLLSNPKRRDRSPELCIGADHDTTSCKRQGEGALVSCVLSPARVQSTTRGLPSKPKGRHRQRGCCVSRGVSSPIQRGKGR
jgi:hypothetical protein